MKNLYNSLFLNNRLFFLLGTNAAIFVIGFFIPFFFDVARAFLLVIVVLTIIDIITLYGTRNALKLIRVLPERLSNGDENRIQLQIESKYNFPVHINIIEELPFQFQKRDFSFKVILKPNTRQETIQYKLTPRKRGEYEFGHVNIYANTPLKLATRKFILGEEKNLKCFPSFLKLNKFTVSSFTDSNAYGTKKVRRIGHSLEFEQIKEYVAGDDIRTLNWNSW